MNLSVPVRCHVLPKSQPLQIGSVQKIMLLVVIKLWHRPTLSGSQQTVYRKLKLNTWTWTVISTIGNCPWIRCINCIRTISLDMQAWLKPISPKKLVLFPIKMLNVTRKMISRMTTTSDWTESETYRFASPRSNAKPTSHCLMTNCWPVMSSVNLHRSTPVTPIWLTTPILTVNWSNFPVTRTCF